ncbi:hypothetical protein Ctob_001112 [Chrysochromulina tobinii]|uniref:Uncharacterized protein n=1 Tax=Chrysochromulina tobinii TaxID=1460289 RepID=A0A0M0J6D5_9EUKA|nr:hypothetical protein Ctob_001112 [Chrysochromulina tobinii]|eukprot:KOO21793.1 hypothetical protein Ctob_001112 [Chrysochromulina sp. CCMP291]
MAEAVELHCGDLFDHPLADATLVFVCCVTWGPAIMQRLAAKLATELPEGARIVTVGQRLPEMFDLGEKRGAVRFEEAARIVEACEWGRESFVVHRTLRAEYSAAMPEKGGPASATDASAARLAAADAAFSKEEAKVEDLRAKLAKAEASRAAAEEELSAARLAHEAAIAAAEEKARLAKRWHPPCDAASRQKALGEDPTTALSLCWDTSEPLPLPRPEDWLGKNQLGEADRPGQTVAQFCRPGRSVPSPMVRTIYLMPLGRATGAPPSKCLVDFVRASFGIDVRLLPASTVTERETAVELKKLATTLDDAARAGALPPMYFEARLAQRERAVLQFLEDYGFLDEAARCQRRLERLEKVVEEGSASRRQAEFEHENEMAREIERAREAVRAQAAESAELRRLEEAASLAKASSPTRGGRASITRSLGSTSADVMQAYGAVRLPRGVALLRHVESGQG